MPPLQASVWLPRQTWRETLEFLCTEIAAHPSFPAGVGQSIAVIREAGPAWLEAQAMSILDARSDAIDASAALFILAALQVHGAALAAGFVADKVNPLDIPGICPLCGTLPVASMVCAHPPYSGYRYLHCALCATEWHMVRVQCTQCGASGKDIAYQSAASSTADSPIADAGAAAVRAETCEHCHWPQNFNGVRLRVFSKFADDEKNTPSETVLLMLTGGNKFAGIHGAHLGPGVRIRYAATDATRQTIPWVEYRNTTTGDGQIFASSDSSLDSVKNLPTYEMQCVDCHNRPTHVFDLPERAVDKALARGDIPVTLPYVKKKSVELLKASYSTREDAAVKLPAAFMNFYERDYPELYAKRMQDARHAAEAVLAIYNRNVFPELKVTWGTYPNNLGHTDSPGCFRCHDGSHTSAKGKTIAQDCDTCHQSLATDEASPEILKTLGIDQWISKPRKQ